MSHDKQTLLACPFCGSKAVMINLVDGHRRVGCNGKTDCAGRMTSICDDSETAVAAWNKRAPAAHGKATLPVSDRSSMERFAREMALKDREIENQRRERAELNDACTQWRESCEKAEAALAVLKKEASECCGAEMAEKIEAITKERDDAKTKIERKDLALEPFARAFSNPTEASKMISLHDLRMAHEAFDSTRPAA